MPVNETPHDGISEVAPNDRAGAGEAQPESTGEAVQLVRDAGEGFIAKSLTVDLVPPRIPRRRSGFPALAFVIGFAAWLVPGLGHLLTGKWFRGVIFFFCVGGLALAGYALRGNVFARHSNDPFGTLGFLADVGSGMFYALARFFERAGPDVSRASGDYGTRFIAAAGVVNLLGVFDAFEIGAGRRD